MKTSEIKSEKCDMYSCKPICKQCNDVCDVCLVKSHGLFNSRRKEKYEMENCAKPQNLILQKAEFPTK